MARILIKIIWATILSIKIKIGYLLYCKRHTIYLSL